MSLAIMLAVKILSRAAVLALVALAGCGGSSPPPSAPPSGPPTAAPVAKSALKAPGDATVGDRTTCPISGEEFTVSAASPKHEHQGKTYYFCCGGCDQKFASDPEKYLKKKPDA
jgi:YHS domain-containing protein